MKFVPVGQAREAKQHSNEIEFEKNYSSMFVLIFISPTSMSFFLSIVLLIVDGRS